MVLSLAHPSFLQAVIGSDSMVELFETQVEVGNQRVATFAALEGGFTLDGVYFGTLTQKDFKSFSTSAQSVDWLTSGTITYLAAGGNNGTEDIIIYEFDDNQLTSFITQSYGTIARSVSWTVTGTITYLAVAGRTSMVNDLTVYEFSGSTLDQVASVADLNNQGWSVDWLTSGTTPYLAVAAENGTEDVIVYSFNPLAAVLTQLDSEDFGSEANTVQWTTVNEVDYLAAGGNDNPGSDDLRIYSFDGGTLTQKDQKSLGRVRDVSWNTLNGVTYLAVVGLDTESLIIYEFDPSSETLTQIDSRSYAVTGRGAGWETINDHTYLGVAADNDTEDIIIYEFDPTSAAITTTIDTADFNPRAINIKWKDINSSHYVGIAGSSGVAVYSFDLADYPTFDSIFPVSGEVDFNQSELELQRDLILHNFASIAYLGDIIGNGHAFDLAKSVSCLPLTSARAGNLDPTFNGDGIFIGVNTTAFRAVMIQDDGKIVVGGRKGNSMWVSRFNTDGTFDTSFSGTGILIVSISANRDDIHDIVFQVDDKIVLAGTAGENIATPEFAVLRLDTDGTLDTSFDTDGIVTTTIGSANEGRGVVIQSDDKIIVAGTSDNDFAMVRYNTDGSEDYTFGGGSARVTTSIGTTDAGNAVLLQTNGKIIIAGTSDNHFALARYDTDGSLDSSFGTGGIVTTNIGGFSPAYDAALQTDGKIIVVGRSNSDLALARYDTDGSLDSSFGSGGTVITNIQSSQSDIGYSVSIQDDGKIIASGSSGNGTIFVTRYNTDGSLDSSFGTNGIIIISLPVVTNVPTDTSSVLQSDGKIVISVDSAIAGVSSKGLVVRLFGDTICYTYADLNLCLNCNVKLNDECLLFEGDSVINGRGNNLTLFDNAQITVAQNSTLLLKNITIKGINGTNINLLDSTSTMSLLNCTWILDDDYTFTMGHFDVVKDWHIKGKNQTFAYQSPEQSTIQECGRMIVDYKVTFSYDPITTDNDLLSLTNDTSQLILRGATLSSTATGLQLTKGKLLIERKSYVDSQATNVNEAISFGDGVSSTNNLNIQFFPGAVLQLTNGFLVDNNI